MQLRWLPHAVVLNVDACERTVAAGWVDVDVDPELAPYVTDQGPPYRLLRTDDNYPG